MSGLIPQHFIDDLIARADIVEVLGEGVRKDVTGQDGVTRPACCYPVDTIDNTPGDCVIGRPYFEGSDAITAPVSGANASHAPSSRGAAWARAAAFEHASVAAFARLSLQLMAHGAPTALLGEVHRAALDETRHAEELIPTDGPPAVAFVALEPRIRTVRA